MSVSQLTLSASELKVCSGACLTYLGVPFHRTEPSRTTPADLEQIERLFHRLVNIRRELHDRNPPTLDPQEKTRVDLSEADLTLLTDVVIAVLRENEPPSDHSNRNLEIHVGPRQEIDKTLKKLQTTQKPLQPA